MNFNFDKNIENFLSIITKNAQNQNFRVFFVGGIVRDYFLNKPNLDLDLLITTNAINFVKKLPKEVHIKSLHEDFCTAKIEYNGIEIDIASSRTESYPYSGCLPVIKAIGVPIEQDVLRRDFSVNAIYCELKLVNNKLNYNIIDLVNGVNDIKNKTLKVLHKNSYIDDPTRILRGLGFKYRFNFDFSKEDKKLIQNYLKNIDYSNMSSDRNLKVFEKVLNNPYQFEIFSEIINNNIYKIINKNNLTITIEDVKKISIKFNLNQEEIANFLIKAMLNDNEETINNKSYLEIQKNFSKLTKTELAYYCFKTSDENIEIFLKIKDMAIKSNGKTLLNLGYKKGKIIGQILKHLLNTKLKNPIQFKSQQDEINWILKHYPKN